jgi:quercetin dioxygenase-like cupin family protein
MQRVVTGHNEDGKSVFVSIGKPPRIDSEGEHTPQFTYCWGTTMIPHVPAPWNDPTPAMPLFPAPEGTSFVLAQFPGYWEVPMHTTETVDYVTILSGEVWLILDNGAEVHLEPGDCVVQNGTQHAWHNRNPEPCVLVAAIIGAKRQD